MCILLTAVLGSVALAVDFGRLCYTAAEVQAAADAAALAAVSASQLKPNSDSQDGPDRAQQIGRLNHAAGQPVSVATADVLPMLYDPATRAAILSDYHGTVNAVQVTTRAQANYIFAGILHLTAPSVARRGTAWIANVNGAECVRPVSLPYTRIYEDANRLATKPYSSTNTYAPSFTQQQITALAPSPGVSPTSRTFVLVPPWETESYWDNQGRSNTGSWHTVNYQNNGWSALQTYIGASVGSATCAPATTQVGSYLYPLTWDKSTVLKTYLHYVNDGFVQLCNRTGTADNAQCLDAKGNVGVEARVPMSDSIPNPTGTFSQRVRMVTQVRIMCYFRGPTDGSTNVSPDVCASAQISNGTGTATWQMPSAYPGGPPVDKGYPSGTVVVLLDGPVSIDLTPDVVLGDSLSFSQRLVLVK